jgi:hypothetical protein
MNPEGITLWPYHVRFGCPEQVPKKQRQYQLYRPRATSGLNTRRIFPDAKEEDEVDGDGDAISPWVVAVCGDSKRTEITLERKYFQ